MHFVEFAFVYETDNPSITTIFRERAYTPIQTNPESTGRSVNAADRMMAHCGLVRPVGYYSNDQVVYMEPEDRKSLEDIRNVLGTVAAWAGGIALAIGGLLWLDSQSQKLR